MSFVETEDQQLLRQTIRDFALKELLPDYPRWDRGDKLPPEKIRDLASLGILSVRIPEKYGGQPVSFVDGGIINEELARGDFNYTLFPQLGAIHADLLDRFASEEIKQEWLPRMASGDAVMAFGLTEPAVGSDAARISTRAVLDGDDYRITGEKSSITLAGLSTVGLVFARSGGEGARGISAFIVPLDLPGVSREVYRSPGERLTQRGSLYFDNVRIPRRYRIGEEGTGFIQAMQSFDYNRANIALACIGAALQSIDETIEYTKERHAFGKPLARNQGVSFQVAESSALLEGARQLAYRCLALKDAGLPHTKEAAMAKWLGPRFGAEAIHTCLILHGHYGYNQDTYFEQRWRDVVGLEIGDGTPEVMKGVIVRELYGKDFNPFR